jgi:ABC-type tungstate transport system substrate-binding protein
LENEACCIAVAGEIREFSRTLTIAIAVADAAGHISSEQSQAHAPVLIRLS